MMPTPFRRRPLAVPALLALVATLGGCCSTPESVTTLSEKTAALDAALDAKQDESLTAYADFTLTAEEHVTHVLALLEEAHRAHGEEIDAHFAVAREFAVQAAFADYQSRVLELLSVGIDEALETNLRQPVEGLLAKIEADFESIVDRANGAPSASQLERMEELQREYRQIELLVWREEAVFRAKVAEMAHAQSATVLARLEATADAVATPAIDDWSTGDQSYATVRTAIEAFRRDVASAANSRTLASAMLHQYLTRPSIGDLVVGGLKDGVSATIADAADGAGAWVEGLVGGDVFGLDVAGFVSELGDDLAATVNGEIDGLYDRIGDVAGDLRTDIDDAVENHVLRGE